MRPGEGYPGRMPRSPTQRWLDDFFAAYYEYRPVNATFVGVHAHDHRLPDLSDGGMGDLVAGMEGLLARARRLEGERWGPSSPAARQDIVPPGSPAHGGASASAMAARAEALDLRLATGFLKITLWEAQSGHGPRGNPAFYTGEAIFGVLSLFLSDFAPLAERVESAIQRLEAVPVFLEEGRCQLLAGPGCHREWTRRALRECQGALAFLGEGVEALCADLMSANPSGPGTVSAADLVPPLRRAAATAAHAFSGFHAWLMAHQLPRHQGSPACGPDLLELHIREGHFLPYRAREIADHARDEMAAAEAWLQAHARDFGAATPVKALAGLKALHPPAGGYLARYGETWEACRRVAVEGELVTWPDLPIRYVERPRWARAAAPWLYFLFYRSPAAYGAPPVHEYLVAPLPESEEEREAFLQANNDSVIRANHVVHHGGLGHHVQNGHALGSPSRVGRMAAVDCAARIALHCGGTMAEGWACYATDLMAELAEAGLEGGFTPLEAYAERAARLRMCARAVVDVELHSGRMTLEEAAAFYRDRAGMPEASALSEAVKNSMYPGMALMYLMGTDEIRESRRETSAALGPAFRLLDFHDRLLSWGSIPVTLAAEMVREDLIGPTRPGAG